MNHNYDCIIIVSFPRSGTHFLIDSILHNVQISQSQYYDISHIKLLLNEETFISFTLPQKISNWFSLRSNIQTLEKLDNVQKPLVVKADHLLPEYYEKHKEFLNKQKIIYIYRKPESVMKSYYHYVKIGYNVSYKSIGEFLHSKHHFGGEFSDLTVMECWSRHVSEWTSKENVLTLSFEQMKSDYQNSMERISLFLGIALTKNKILFPRRLPYNKALRTGVKLISRFLDLHYGITGIVGRSREVKINLTQEDSDYIAHNSKSILEKLEKSTLY
jgi:hypothetical protein